MIHQECHSEISRAAGQSGEFRCAQAKLGIVRSRFVANAHFCKPAETKSKIQARACFVDPVDCQGIVHPVNLEVCIACFQPWRDKPSARRGKRPVELSCNSVGVSKTGVRPPLRAVAEFVLKRQPRRLREVHVATFRSIYFESQLQIRRRIIFFVYRNEQAALASLIHHLVACPIEFPESRQPRQPLIELCVVNRLARKRSEEFLHMLCRFRIRPFHFHELRHRHRRFLPARARLQILRAALQQCAGDVDVAHIGCGAHHRVHQARGGIHANVRFHPEVPLVAFLHLMHLRVAFAFGILGGTRRRDERGVHHGARAQHQRLNLFRFYRWRF